ncbi:MAG: hypothetical protein JO261_08895 [Alphaproteobacteria bacterium]|nr:hypothetical protein [Alphaproteobacteria bacterium]
MTASLEGRRTAPQDDALVSTKVIHALAHREFLFRAFHQRLHPAQYISDILAKLTRLAGMRTGLERVAVAGRRSYAWLPNIFGPQHFES